MATLSSELRIAATVFVGATLLVGLSGRRVDALLDASGTSDDRASAACAQADYEAGRSVQQIVFRRGLPETAWLVTAVREIARARRLCADGQEAAGMSSYARFEQLARYADESSSERKP